MDFRKLRENLINQKIEIDDLLEYKGLFEKGYFDILSGKLNNKPEIESFIRLCLDYYTYSNCGDVLIKDIQYDEIMNYWISKGENVIVYPDSFADNTSWGFIKHEIPGMVGTVKKVYSEKELSNYLNKYKGVHEFILAPKYDGISVSVKVLNGKIQFGVTRANGIEGQDITLVVTCSKNARQFSKDGYYKCELCVSQSDFEELIFEKEYKNRRSATSGIVNSPKNLHLAKYITIIPLLYRSINGEKLEYIPPDSKKVIIKNVTDAMEEIKDKLLIIRKSDYPFRTDGVILYPLFKDLYRNEYDYMDDSIAYKVNTAEAFTEIEYGYMSIGRMGNAVPMLKVKPVEVNETIVTDVSLGSYDKYAGMDLHEGETVIVYSAGDVIPQIMIPYPRQYKASSDYLKIKKRCSYCGEKLERIGSEYKCVNPDCVRLITGRITNFLNKLGAENFSDRTVEILYENKLLRSIEDLFKLELEDLIKLKGFNVTSAMNLITEIDIIKEKEISVSTLFGALGITNISEKKCRNIFKVISLDYLLEKSREKIYFKLLNAENIGDKTANVFIDFVIENRPLIKFLIKNMNITIDKKYKGSIVFTGFRNPELKKEIESYGFEVTDSVNNQTIALVSASTDHSSTKCKSATKKGISIVDLADIDDLLKELKKR